MDELDKKLFSDLSEQVEIPIRCEYIIKNALKSRKNKNTKDTRNFKIFTNVAYKDIENYRGTQEEVQRIVEEICKKQGYDLSAYNHKEINFNISQKVYEEALLNNVYIEDSPENATIWEIKYNKEYNGIINKYEEITVGIVPEINELYYNLYNI